MRIPVSCGSCSNEFSANETSAGKRVKCPACGEGVRVPQADDEQEPPRRSSGSKKSKGKSAKSAGVSPILIGVGAGGGVAVLALALFLLSNRGGNQPSPVAQPGPPTMTQPPLQQPSVAHGNTQPPVSSPAIGHNPMPPTSPQMAHNPAPPTSPQMAHNPAPPTSPQMAHNPGPPKTGNMGVPVSQSPNTQNPNLPGIPPTGTGAAQTTAAPVDNTPLRELSMTELVAQVDRSVVRIIVKSDQGASVGSGFVIDVDGSIMTNYHVIEGSRTAEVEFETGEKANVVGFTTIDKARDLAIIKIGLGQKPLQQVRVASELPQKGEKVAAFGAPRGLGFTASDGIISAIRKTPEFPARSAGTYLQTTAPISPGNSGGPLVNMRGEVVGVNSFKMEGENLNFAASATDIRDVIANRGSNVTPLSPEALPNVYTEKFGRAENLAGTTKGNMLLGSIHDAIIMMLPFTFDPSGRVSDNVELQVEKNLIKKAGWTKVTKQSQVKGSTALVVVLIYFQQAEKVKDADKKGVSELMCRVRIVARDVDKDGVAYTAIVWDENGALGTISLNSLLSGGFPPTMKSKISEFFNKIYVGIKKAQRNAGDGDDEKSEKAK